mgnify:CR=1 FL=1
MKKITSVESISFRYDASTLLEIDSEGVLASDVVAKLAQERLGDNITVEDAGPDGGPEKGSDEDEDKGPTYNELKEEAKELGISAKGSKDEIAERIAAHKAEVVEAEKLAADGKKKATQEDLDNMPDLVDAGVNVGDVIDIPATE